MILTVKDIFAPFVQDGTKTSDICAGFRWKVGMRADLYARQKGMRLIFRAPVVRVQKLSIREVLIGNIMPGGSLTEALPRIVVEIDGVRLDIEETNNFFYGEGFRSPQAQNTGRSVYPSTSQTLDSWRGRLPFLGQVIHWDYEERFMAVSETCYHLTRARAKRWGA